MHPRLFLTTLFLLSGCTQQAEMPESKCPDETNEQAFSRPPLALPEATEGLYVGKYKISYVVQRSGAVTDIEVDLSEVRLNGEPLVNEKYRTYAVDRLRNQKLLPQKFSCRMSISGWSN
ncbi:MULTISPECIES: hypothetical protein [unclassified Xanthomonas]|uniref:hypothetical protein n=1 Tax=unclassified Xanthomonas TaxID=2643310 RepID=UPI0011B049E4|nr:MULTISPECIES: hypothetical protein [unclassified Xanthomonas]